MSTLYALAEAVVAELTEYDAELNFAPDFKLSNLATRQVVVVPMGKECKLETRSSSEIIHRIEIGVLYRAKAPDVPSLIRIVESIGAYFLRKQLLNQTCFAVTWEPIYSADDLRSKNQFTSVISLRFKENA